VEGFLLELSTKYRLCEVQTIGRRTGFGPVTELDRILSAGVCKFELRDFVSGFGPCPFLQPFPEGIPATGREGTQFCKGASRFCQNDV
jgi:hypothetical protein